MSTVSTAPAEATRRVPLDLRLAAGAAAAWLAVLAAAGHSSTAVLALGGAACAVALLALLGPVRRTRAAAAIGLAAFCAALALLPLAGRLRQAERGPLLALAGSHAAVTVTTRVTADPRLLAAKGPSGSARVLVESDADAVSRAGGGGSVGAVPADGQVLVLGDAQAWRDVLPGQRVRLAGELSPDLTGDVLSVTLFARDPPQLLGEPPWWQRTAAVVRHGLRRAAAGLPDQERGLLPGLVDGDTAGLDPVLAERFRLAGLTHLVAVSGTNCSIVVGAVLLVLRRLRVRPWCAAVVGAGVLVMFVVVARPSPSVLRAALMAGVALSALAGGRPRAAVPALAAVTLGLLVWDPTLAASASFAMSVLATGALLVVAPGWARALRGRRVPVGVAEAVAVAAAAHVVTAPVIAALSGRVSLVAVPANVLAEPVVALVTVLGFLAALVAPVWLGGASALAWLAGWPCRWLVGVADFFGGLHGATLPWPGGASGGLALLAVFAGLGAIAIRAGPRRVLAAAAGTSLLVLVPGRAATSSWPPGGWVFAACDVGQGDALLLDAGPGAAVEVDAGPEPVATDRCLRDLGVDRIPLLVLTHFHLDHVGGLAGAVRGRSVGAVLAGPLADPEGGVAIAHAVLASRGLRIVTPPVGYHVQVGAVGLDVLGPRAAFHGTRSDPNNSSLVLRAQVGGVRILLPGDAELEEQRAVLASGADVRADVLKVPHHGSAYSDPAFLAAVHAKVAVVSVGLHNDYGHPSPVLVDELARLGVPLRRTDHDGDVAVTAHEGALTTVVRGTASSTVGLGPPRGRTASPGPRTLPAPRPASEPAMASAVASAGGARMAPCPPAPSVSTTCPSRCRRWSPSSATRSCWSTARSARSPPPRAAPIRRSRSPT